MSYQKHIWITKEIIRREYLQNMEDGIYNEEQRALLAESTLDGKIQTEKERAIEKENTLASNIASEI